MKINDIYSDNQNFFKKHEAFLKSKNGLGHFITTGWKFFNILGILLLIGGSAAIAYYLVFVIDYFNIFIIPLLLVDFVAIFIPGVLLLSRLIIRNNKANLSKNQVKELRSKTFSYGVVLHSNRKFITFLCYTQDVEKELILSERNAILSILKGKKNLDFAKIHELIQENNLDLIGKLYICNYSNKKVRKLNLNDVTYHMITQNTKLFKNKIVSGFVHETSFIPFGYDLWENNILIKK